MNKIFESYAATETNPKWLNMISRESPLYSRNNDIRSAFERDYTRIIHSLPYRRLKHKTQVFFSPRNDHICTRIEHVIHVDSVSYTIAKALGLNVELTKAIANGHDLGHSPFGHQGEKILSQLSIRDIDENFWHEKNGLDMVDKIELLEDPDGNLQNMNLTYAVRDGIISHCGEIDENAIRPREKYIDLREYQKPNQYAPYTWEACVVKVSDKISYLGRDIADAITLGLLNGQLEELKKLLGSYEVINNTVLINDLIFDLCTNSTPETGLCFSNNMFNLIKEIKRFNYKNIYLREKLIEATKFFELVLTSIYEFLKKSYKNREEMRKIAPELLADFEAWLKNYWNKERYSVSKNKVVFDIEDEKSYYRAIIYYISGMTDNYAIEMYNKIIRF